MRGLWACIAVIAVPLLNGCSFTQPVAEVTAQTVVAPLPVNFAKIESRDYCLEHAAQMHGQKSEPEQAAALNQEVEAYQALVEGALVHRAETVRLVERLRLELDRREPLSGKDLAELNAGLADHLALRERLFRVAQAHECWLGASGPAEAMAPLRRLQGIMISLSAALVLYDNYLLAISLYQEEPRLRMLLNNKDVGYGIDYGELNRVALSFASEENRNRVRRGIAYYESEIGGFEGLVLEDRHLLFLDQLIRQSPSYSMTKRFSPLAYLGRKLEFYAPFTIEALLRLKDEGLNMGSMIFGNTVGLVESRRGKLHGRRDVAEDLTGELRTGDILVERTPFRLTNSFIPGRWGHAAVWVGTEEELQALGIWEHPVVQPHQDAIRQGRRVVEALRSGVELNTLNHFLNVDDVAVLRHTAMEPKEKADAILQALRQTGKRYDFNFDVETRDRVGCAELVYHAFGRIDWPTQSYLGRSTVAPDNIVFRALDEGPLAVVRLYNDGEKVLDEPKQALERLMAARDVGE